MLTAATMRFTPKRAVKFLFLFSLLSFFYSINVSTGGATGDSQEDDLFRLDFPQAANRPTGDRSPPEKFAAANKRDLPPAAGINSDNRNSVNINTGKHAGRPGASDLFVTDQNLTTAEIKRVILDVNNKQTIYNLDKYGLNLDAAHSKSGVNATHLNSSSIVVVVQVHTRVAYLKHLINSLRKARDSHRILLIFSHDYYSSDINKLVSTVDFCPVMQIFYPFSMQLFPSVFPGQSPEDCPKNIKKAEAIAVNCNNALTPDMYGHYRVANTTQIKHHWFWKISHVFERLNVTRNYKGPVLFLEEDHYLVDDFILVLDKMFELKQTLCKDCDIFTLGAYDKSPNYRTLAGKVALERWMSSKHNMGMAFTREMWTKIRKCAKRFCEFDDYNWDWSLQKLGQDCLNTNKQLKVMVASAPRIHHLGTCGIHHKGKHCDPQEHVDKLEIMLQLYKEKLFPSEMKLLRPYNGARRGVKANGGWGDTRDHKLCLSFVSPDTR